MKKFLTFALALVLVFSAAACTSTDGVDTPDSDSEVSGQPLSVHFIDVGQGDCTLVDFGDVEILVDGGDYDTWEAVEEYIRPLVNGKLDYVIATHPDADHVGGLTYILTDFSIGTIIDSGSYKNTETYSNYIASVGASDGAVVYDDDMTFDLGGGAVLSIIETGDSHADVNDDSVVSEIRYGSFSLLMTGDMGCETERENLKKFRSATVLKAAHHGSSYSTSEDFLERVRPDYVIISAGKDNSYGHPHAETLSRISDAGAQALSTTEYGTIIAETDGKRISIYGSRQ